MNPTLIGLLTVLIFALVGIIIATKNGLLKSLYRSPVQPPLNVHHPLVIELAAELRALDALPISTKEERIAWDNAREAFDEKLRTSWQSIYDMLPHELEHYLSDVEIRAKEPAYAQLQRNQLATLLTLAADTK